jgi:Right handed beta helix region
MFALEENHPSRRRPLRIAVALLSALALAGVSALALGHRASPKPVVLVPQATTTVHCGDTITVSIVVGNDLNCPNPPGGNGLNVEHASIIINLNGHTLAGNTGGVGVKNAGGFSGVTIENGTVSGWSQGVYTNGSANKLTALRASANLSDGLVLNGSGSTALSNVLFKNAGPGIIVLANNVKVVSNTVRENTGSGGIVVGSVSGVVLQTNQVENNGIAGILDLGAGTAMTGNVTNGNSSDGVNSASDGTASVATTTANYNGAYGIEGSPGGKDGGGNLAKGNTTAAQCKDVVCA